MTTLITLIVFLAISLAIGGACSYFLKGYKAYLAAALIPWTIFLFANLYSEYYGNDRELMQGSWPWFQLSFGAMVAVLGCIGAWLIAKLSMKKHES